MGQLLLPGDLSSRLETILAEQQHDQEQELHLGLKQLHRHLRAEMQEIDKEHKRLDQQKAALRQQTQLQEQPKRAHAAIYPIYPMYPLVPAAVGGASTLYVI